MWCGPAPQNIATDKQPMFNTMILCVVGEGVEAGVVVAMWCGSAPQNIATDKQPMFNTMILCVVGE